MKTAAEMRKISHKNSVIEFNMRYVRVTSAIEHAASIGLRSTNVATTEICERIRKELQEKDFMLTCIGLDTRIDW